MVLMFDTFELDLSKRELRQNGDLIPLEPKAFDLIVLLIEHRDRVVSKTELVDHLWQGRFISDASLSSAVKSARRGLGDTGKTQHLIKTVHGRGFRFVGDVTPTTNDQPAASARQELSTETAAPFHGTGRPGLAVLRFLSVGKSRQGDALAQALPAELIAGLSRMKWLHVIARGSSFRFDPQDFDPSDIATRLNVGYIITGLIEPLGRRLAVSLEVQSTGDGTLVWSERFTCDQSEIQLIREEIISATISALEISIPEFEAMRTRVLSPDQFDAWSYFHLGLTHAFRFSPHDNTLAAEHFRRALELDPQFARAHAGMSFMHWQNAFMRMGDAKHDHLEMAVAAAKQALDINPNDPFGNFCMGRALWYSEDMAASVAWLDRGLMVNPNYAHCHYTKGMVLNMGGDYSGARTATRQAMSLSPLDPLYYGMLANQTLSEIAQDNLESAMVLAEKAVHSPGSYYYPVLWAAIAAELSGQRTTMERWRDKALAEWPTASVDAMLQTFPLKDPVLTRTVTGSLRRMGIP